MNLDPQSALRESATLMLDMGGTLLDLAFDNYMWQELVPRRYAVENDMSYDDARTLLMSKYRAVQGNLDWYCLDHWCDCLGFDVVHSSHNYGFAKENQKFWHALQEEVDFACETTLFVYDSQPVLKSAEKFGIEMLVTVTHSDTSAPEKTGSTFRSVRRVADMLSH